MYWRAFRAAPEALLVVNAAGLVRLANVAAERLFRRAAADLVGQPVEVLFVGDPRASEQRATTSAVRLPDGRQLPVDVRLSTLEGDPTGLVVLQVTDQGSAEKSRATLERRVARLTATGHQRTKLLDDVILTHERERARIAAGVHDDSLQVLTAALLRLQHLRKRLREPKDVELLDRLEEAMVSAADRLRRLIFDFRPPKLERAGLVAATRDLLEGMEEDAGLQVHLESHLAEEPPLPTRLLIYRMLQEALANVSKHADADRVAVKLDQRDGGYQVRVIDDGVGTAAADEPEPGHLGLLLMRERAALAGGWFHMISAPAAGTTVEFWIPSGADLQTNRTNGGDPP